MRLRLLSLAIKEYSCNISPGHLTVPVTKSIFLNFYLKAYFYEVSYIKAAIRIG